MRDYLYLHDDWREWSQYDEHSSLPLILSARCVVSNAVDLVDHSTREILERQYAWPEKVVAVDRSTSLSTISSILHDHSQTAELAELVTKHSLPLSLFYPNHPQTDKLLVALGRTEIANQPKDDTDPIHRSTALARLRMAGVNVLKGCLFGVHRSSFKSDQRIVCKPGHSPAYSTTIEQLEADKLDNPVYVEEWIPILDSYCIHFEKRRGYFGSNQQLIKGYTHCGNSTHNQIPSEVVDVATHAAIALGSSSKIVGIDVVVAEDGQVYVSDVNERYNTSSYVHLYLNSVFPGQSPKFLMQRRSCSLSKYKDFLEYSSMSYTKKNSFSLRVGACQTNASRISYYDLLIEVE